MFPPRCLERVDARLSLCARDRANLLDAAAAAAGIDDDKQLEPYETMGDFAAECKRIFDNAVARVDSTVVWHRGAARSASTPERTEIRPHVPRHLYPNL